MTSTELEIKKSLPLIPIMVALVCLGLGFFGGMQYQKRQRTIPGGLFTGGRQASQNRGQNFRPIAGQISSLTDNTLTIALSDGSSKIVILSDKTTINKASSGVRGDLKTGEKVSAFGVANADGSITANMISIGDIVGTPRGPQ